MDFSLKTCNPTILGGAAALPQQQQTKLLNNSNSSEQASSLVNMSRLNEVLAALAKHHHHQQQTIEQANFPNPEILPQFQHLQFNSQLLALQNLRPLSELSTFLQQQSTTPALITVPQPSYLSDPSLMTPPSLLDVLNLHNNNNPVSEGNGSSTVMSNLLHQLMATAPTVQPSPPAKRAKTDFNNNHPDFYPSMPPPLPSPPVNCSSVHSSSCVSSTQNSPVHISKSQLVRRLSTHSNNTCTSTSSVSNNKTPQRKPAAPIPDEKKDDAYFERRRKNNDAAKRSRDSRRKKEEITANRAESLERENELLRRQLGAVKEELRLVKLHIAMQSRKISQSTKRPLSPANLCTATALLLLNNNNNCAAYSRPATIEQDSTVKLESGETGASNQTTENTDTGVVHVSKPDSPVLTSLEEF